ncbi:MAG: hypothetical protein H0V88_01915 [Pyrinomonadaceae bacterium]|nr:hypothetical protein [Pyrinomonadaceae bacterium]
MANSSKIKFALVLVCVANCFNVAAEGQTRTNRETRVAVPYRSDFDVDVLTDGRRLEEYPAQGRFYVEAVEGAEYELRIRNPLSVRIAVALAVDGLNTIDARRTTAWGASKWVIEPYATITIGGWQMSSERARRFYFTTERDSYAARMNRTADLGVISAVFFRERQPSAITRPSPRGIEDNERQQSSARRAPSTAGSADSNEAARAGIYSSAPEADDASAATGIGRSVRNDVRHINMNLDSQPITAITIRYEYRDALVRLGILPRAHMSMDVLRRREHASGFEAGYCPEP